MQSSCDRYETSSTSSFASVAPVSQVTLNISGEKAEKTFERCRQEVLSWLANRVGKPLPESAWAGRSFEMEEVGAQRAAVTTLNDPRYWTARLDDADKQVPQRVWITEVGIASNPEGGTVFGRKTSVLNSWRVCFDWQIGSRICSPGR